MCLSFTAAWNVLVCWYLGLVLWVVQANSSLSATTLFRRNSIATKLIKVYFAEEGSNYMKGLLQVVSGWCYVWYARLTSL